MLMDDEKLAMQRRIDSLDQHAVKLHAALTEYERENARLKAELETVKRERDAAVSDLDRSRNCLTCEVNRDLKDENTPEFHLLCLPCHYAWRGPCKENGGAEDG